MSQTFAIRKRLFIESLPLRSERSCSARGKISYPNRHDAMAVATEMNLAIRNRKRRKGIEGKSARWKAFQCEHCKTWHVGRETLRQERARPNREERFA